MSNDKSTASPLLVGDYVHGGKGHDEYDMGEVVTVDGDQITVAWKGSRETTTQHRSALSAFAPREEIEYSITIDTVVTHGTWLGCRRDALDEAIGYLHATPYDAGRRWSYEDDATRQRYGVMEDDMVRLGAALFAAREHRISGTPCDAYGLWCSDTSPEELGA